MEKKAPPDPRIDEILRQLREMNNKIVPIVALTPIIANSLNNIPTPEGIKNAAASGTCQTLQPGGCSRKALDPIQNSAADAAANSKKAADQLDALYKGLDLSLLGTINSKLDGVHSKLGSQIPNGGVGGLLQKIGSRVSKTWDFLQIDRVLNVLTYVNTLHNAYMLSSGLMQTLFSAIANVLDVFGVEDAEGNPLDVSGIVKKWTESFFKKLFGVETVDGIKRDWAKFNRIYQAASNVLWSVQSIFDSMRSLTSIAIENTGKIGNALRKAGVVFENAYGNLVEKATARNAFQKRMDDFAEGIGQIESVISTVDSAASEVLSIQSTVKELKNQQKEFKDSVAAFTSEADKKEGESKTVSKAPQL
jgi:uncharacterized protein YoxC